MRLLLFAVLLFVAPFANGQTGAPTPVATDLTAKLNSVILSNVEFRQTTVRDALEFLRQEFRRLSGAELSCAFNLTEQQLNTRVSMTLSKVPLLTAFQLVGKTAALKVSVDGSTLCVSGARNSLAATAATPDPRFQVSEARALAMYPDANRPNTPLGKATAAEFQKLIAAKDPILNDARAPEIVASRVAGQLGIPPILANTSFPQTTPSVELTRISPPKSHHLSMEAQSVATGGASNIDASIVLTTKTAINIDTAQATPVNSVDTREQRHLSSGANIEVKVRDFSGTKDTVTLEWYFFAYPVGTTAGRLGGKEIIFDEGSRQITVPAKAMSTWVVESKEAQSSTVRNSTVVQSMDASTTFTFNGLPFTGGQTQSGWIMKGWCMRLVEGGRVLAGRGSSQRYEDLANDDAQLKAVPRP